MGHVESSKCFPVHDRYSGGCDRFRVNATGANKRLPRSKHPLRSNSCTNSLLDNLGSCNSSFTTRNLKASTRLRSSLHVIRRTVQQYLRHGRYLRVRLLHSLAQPALGFTRARKRMRNNIEPYKTMMPLSTEGVP